MQASPENHPSPPESSSPSSGTHADDHELSSLERPATTGKVKRTRRRQRLSCVECTRKRTKCDRQLPCGTCVSRGMAQLCRWEPIVVRPPPQAPPEGAGSTIATLSARIAALEQALLRQSTRAPDNANSSRHTSPQTESHPSPAHSLNYGPATAPSPSTVSASYSASSPEQGDEMTNTAAAIEPFVERPAPDPRDADGDCALSLFDFEVQQAAISMAQMSLAPQDEYVGGGTILCALHKLGDPYRFRFPFPRSADSTTVRKPQQEQQPGAHPLSAQIQKMVSAMPSREKTNILLDAYFAERNWEFGLPERWFRRSCEQMWRHLDLSCPGYTCYVSGGCPRCTQELNPHWLSLFFAVLALAPRRVVGAGARMYFLKAMEARRLVEDITLSSRAYAQSSTAVDGVVQSCIGAALLAKYLADRGRVSDAWKLAGTALRTAQAAGLHRDPGWQKWDHMDTQEQELRLLGWWSLVMADRLYSFILGRPMMTLPGTFDVKPVPGAKHGDGSPNPFADFQRCIISLFEIIGETIDQCLGIMSPAYATVLEMDRKYKVWLSKLPSSLDWRQNHPTPTTPEERSIAYQRHLCAAYYLGGLMNLHRPYLMHAPPILPPPAALSATMKVIMNPSRERCIETALELVKVVCDCQREAAQWGSGLPATLFHYTYFAFDGAVALMGALSQDPPHPKAGECLALIDCAADSLRACAAAIKGSARAGEDADGEGDVPARAVHVLQALRRAGRWDERFGTNGENTTTRMSTSPDSRPINAVSPMNASAPVRTRPPYTSYGAPTTTASIPYLNGSGRAVAPSPFTLPPGPSHASPPPPPPPDTMFFDVRTQFGTASPVQYSASSPGPFTHAAGLGGSDFAARAAAMRGGTAAPAHAVQGTSMPFEMLLNDGGGGDAGMAAGVDWSMFTEMQAWPGGGLFGTG
ncbi:hypothetical protein C8Q77DRAFT_857003 [Trametes polyzona]|nr:hypothetical protein C8Q77DRAFT_857003 [Trametes polyzona]